MGPSVDRPVAFFLMRDSSQRRAALLREPGSAERYVLFGADQLPARGMAVRHSMEAALAPRVRDAVGDRALRLLVRLAGGYGGDFATVLACRRVANACDVVFSTVDTVGIPLALLARARLVRSPFVYTSIGLLERLEHVRAARTRRFYLDAIGRARAIVAYSRAEAEALRRWLAPLSSPPTVSFVPFGVDTTYFAPIARAPDVDVVSVGADPQRDYALLARVAARLPQHTFLVVAAREQAVRLHPVPPNMTVEVGLPFDGVRSVLARARVVALPVRENLYSGATTTLLQALAMGCPVVVTRAAAIASGYGLVDGEHCRLVPPADPIAFEDALTELLRDRDLAVEVGARGREHVVRELDWDRYVDALEAVIRGVAPRGAQLTA
jgi:glycosyltransferase involved in cell wall biosynthesis